MKTYDEQVWRYVVRRLGSHAVLHQADDEADAVRFCVRCDTPCKLVRTSDDEVVYANC